MIDPLVKIISVRDIPGFNVGTLESHTMKVVTFTVGSQGPFTKQYQASEYNQQRVEQDIQEEVDTLRGIGAIPAAGTY